MEEGNNMSANTCTYLNTDLTSLIQYITNKYNLAASDVSNITAMNKDYSHVYDNTQPKVRDKFTGGIEYQWLSYNNSTIGQLLTYIYHGFISMSNLDDGRAMFVMESNLGNDDDIKKFKTVWDDSKGCVYASLSCYGSSIKVIKDLVNEFGGLIDENDCDDKGFYYVSPVK